MNNFKTAILVAYLRRIRFQFIATLSCFDEVIKLSDMVSGHISGQADNNFSRMREIISGLRCYFKSNIFECTIFASHFCIR